MEHDSHHVPIAQSHDVVLARQAGRDLAARMGYGKVDQVRIATAISELARNILQHSGTTGSVAIRPIQHAGRTGIQVLVQDSGVGIADLPRAMHDGYSTAGTLGAGLPGSRRLMDDFQIETAVGKGVQVHMIRWRN